MSGALKSGERATLDDLWELYAKLEQANGALQDAPTEPRRSALQALRAVVEFLHSQPVNHNGYLSRPLEMLGQELSALGDSPPGMILPPYDGGSAGVNRRAAINDLKGEAAFTVELCARCKQADGTHVLRRAAAAEVVAVLERHGFPHGIRRGDKADGLLRTIKRYQDGDAGRAAERYRMLISIEPTEEPTQWGAVGWLTERLERHGFICPAPAVALSGN